MSRRVFRIPSRRSQNGSSVIELALVLPFFLMLTIGMMDFAIGVWSHHTLANAAREAVRYAVVRAVTGGTTDDDIARVARDRAVGLHAQKIDVITEWVPPDRGPGSTVRVVLRYPFDPVTPFIARERVTLEATAAMVVAQ